MWRAAALDRLLSRPLKASTESQRRPEPHETARRAAAYELRMNNVTASFACLTIANETKRSKLNSRLTGGRADAKTTRPNERVASAIIDRRDRARRFGIPGSFAFEKSRLFAAPNL